MTGSARRRLSGPALAAIAIAAGLGMTEAHANLDIFVGYADNIRPSGFFPTVWLGGAGVVSESAANQSFDSGAIRFQNTGGSAVTISNLFVTMNGGGGPTYAIWSPLTIGAGQNGIFTQTASYNFDSSDNATYGPPGNIFPLDPGANGIGGCSSTAAAQAAAGINGACANTQPTVSFSLDGGQTYTTLNDTGHILDTGNYDFTNYSPDSNESINWNQIGSAAVRGGTAAPEPSTWAMMAVGFAGLGFAAYRSKKGARQQLA